MLWGWGAGWWLVSAVFMAVCMLMMVPMMSGMGRMMGGMGRGRWGDGEHGSTDEPERTLAGRLARGEIDVEEYHRLLEALRHADHPARA